MPSTIDRCPVPGCTGDKHRHTATGVPHRARRDGEVMVRFERQQDHPVEVTYRRTPRSRIQALAWWPASEMAARWFEHTAALIRQAGALDQLERDTGRPWFMDDQWTAQELAAFERMQAATA